MRVGLVSDTHGLFEPRLSELFRGCDLILHAGDVVTPGTLADLAQIAPVRAVRGNNDDDAAFDDLPEIAVVLLEGVTAVIAHQIGARGRRSPGIRRAVARHGARILVHGHSHRPGAAIEDGVVVVNPGSAGPRRFRLPRSAAVLELDGRRAVVRLHDLADARLPTLQEPLEADLGAGGPEH
jgi:putative phosphoesterase